MAKNNYIKSKSIYTIKNVHAKTKAGTIYENDYVTIIDNDGIYDDEMALFSESNFKFKINTNENNKKRHIRNGFVKNDNGTEVWTKWDLSGHNVSDESKIVFKTNYSSLKDFAYYGSAVELVKATIKDIILRFPGGLYFYDKNYAPEVEVNGKKYLLISNECQIDCWTSNEDLEIENIKNPLRILSLSYIDYNIDKPVINITSSCLDSIVGTVNIGSYVFDIYNDDDNNYHLVMLQSEIDSNKLYGKKIIEPKEEYFDIFWKNLDDFERVLLNKDTIPLYTSVFDTPYNDETGYYYTPKQYTWPTIGNSNMPDLTTSKFNGYLSSLLSLAEFHDNYDSDNIWRMMTHESIKNMDWTFSSNEKDLSDIDNSKIKSLIHIQGRIYDDVKRYIDNIKYSNYLSYDQKNNVPDYFLSDIIENDGWDAKNTVPFNEKLDKDIVYSANSKTAVLEKSGKTNSYINSVFLRRLGLSSNYIQSMKGTRKGIEAILGMFGYINNTDYKIIEYVAKVDNFLDYDETICLRAEFDYVNSDENVDFMKGYPVTTIEEIDDNGNVSYFLAPWFDKNEKYDYNFYFQPKGGWRKVKNININNEITTIKSISGDTLYSETEPYLLFLENIDELLTLPNNKLYDDMICYVSDIRGIDKLYTIGDKDNGDEFSHYFKLYNKVLSTKLGYVNIKPYNCYGWYNIKKSEYNGEKEPTTDGYKVLYLETIIPNYKSNNPHTGKGNYDFGIDYLDKFTNLFREALNDGKCDKLSKEKKEKIKNVGFGIIKTIDDNDKCKVFINDENYESYKTINVKNLSIIFNTENKNNTFKNEFKNYVLETVVPYLETMIPSTTLYELLFSDELSSNEKFKDIKCGTILETKKINNE